MSVENLIEEVRPVLEELASRMRQTQLECGRDALLWALHPMLVEHREGLDAASITAQEWLNHLAIALLLIHPGWTPTDIESALREASELEVTPW